jgi:hypothetical protein
MQTQKIGISLSIIGVVAALMVVLAPTLESQQASALVYGRHAVVVRHHAVVVRHPFYGRHAVVVRHHAVVVRHRR